MYYLLYEFKKHRSNEQSEKEKKEFRDNVRELYGESMGNMSYFQDLVQPRFLDTLRKLAIERKNKDDTVASLKTEVSDFSN